MSTFPQRPVVLITEGSSPEPLSWLQERAEVLKVPADSPEFAAALQRAEALVVRTYTRIDAALLERAPRLKVVGRGGVGLENIDVTACRLRGVEVVYTPEANTQAVAEFVIATMIRLVRRWHENDQGLFSPDAFKALRDTAGEQIAGLTLGILGMGRVGRAVARAAARGFGMHLVYHDLLDVSRHVDMPAESVSFEELLAECDVLSIHVDARRSNRNLINAATIERSRFRWLINTSRGMVVDTAALGPALREPWPDDLADSVFDPEPRLRGVALDVFEPEPPAPDSAYAHLLREFPERVILTPHMASRTHAALENMSWVVRDVMNVLFGRRPKWPAP